MEASRKSTATLLPFLLQIFNCSISSNTYPDLWKRAFIIPLNKCNNPQLVSDTRPIANLCHLAKVFDKIIATQISEHVETDSLLSPFQFGFRLEHNTQSALLYFTDMIRYGIENNLVTLATLFDFRRAFDSIVHDIRSLFLFRTYVIIVIIIIFLPRHVKYKLNATLRCISMTAILIENTSWVHHLANQTPSRKTNNLSPIKKDYFSTDKDSSRHKSFSSNTFSFPKNNIYMGRSCTFFKKCAHGGRRFCRRFFL